MAYKINRVGSRPIFTPVAPLSSTVAISTIERNWYDPKVPIFPDATVYVDFGQVHFYNNGSSLSAGHCVSYGQLFAPTAQDAEYGAVSLAVDIQGRFPDDAVVTHFVAEVSALPSGGWNTASVAESYVLKAVKQGSLMFFESVQDVVVQVNGPVYANVVQITSVTGGPCDGIEGHFSFRSLSDGLKYYDPVR